MTITVTAVLKETKVGERRQERGFGGEGAEVSDGGYAFAIESVVNIAGEVAADGVGREGDARGPLGNQGIDVGEAAIAGAGKVGDQVGGGE